MSEIIAKRYAKAFYSLAEEQSNLKQVFSDCQRLVHAIDGTPDLVRFLRNPSIGREKRLVIIEKIFKKKMSKGTYAFIRFLAAKNRLALLKEACRAFEALYLKDKNIVKAELASVVKLNKIQVNSLKKSLKLKLKKEIEASAVLDEGLLGGIKMRIQDTVYDYSLKAKLDKYQQSVIHSI